MNAETVATVLEVACLTADRSTIEQRAMLDLAFWADSELSRFSGNRKPVRPRLTYLVAGTYRPERGRHIGCTSAQRAQLERLEAKFVPCEKCGVLAGAHAAECLAADLARSTR